MRKRLVCFMPLAVGFLIVLLAPPVFADRTLPFGAALATPVGVLKAIAVGDVNEDGLADLLTSEYSAASIALLKSTGRGRFGLPESLGLLPHSTLASSLHLADLDHDGHLDLIATTTDSLYCFKGLGGGAFERSDAQEFPTGGAESNAYYLVDVNGDARLDMLAPGPALNGQVLMSHGVAPLAFSPRETVQMPHGVSSVCAEDANGDGAPDLFGYSSMTDSVSVRFALGGGLWGAAKIAIVPGVRAVGDQNGDGNADLWTFANGASSVWRGDGYGTFVQGPLSPMVSVMAYVKPVVADLDGDGMSDLLASIALDPGYALVLLRSLPSGELIQASEWGVGGTPVPFALGDVDGDGRSDAVVCSRDEGIVEVLIGEADGQFAARTLYSSPTGAHGPSSVALSDVNRDGLADLLFENAYMNQLTVYLSQGVGGFVHLQDVPTPTFPEGLSVSDINGDGWADVLLGGADSGVSTQAFALNQGNGSFAMPTYLVSMVQQSALQALAGRLDNDELPDLLYSGYPNPRVAWGEGLGSFAPLDSVSLGGRWASRFALGRVDLGVLDDLVFIAGLESLGVALSDGERGFRLLPTTYVGGTLTDLALADLDANGRADAVVVDVASSTVAVLHSFGNGVFAPPTRYAVGRGSVRPFSVVLGDVDADGFTDIVVSNARNPVNDSLATATVWYNDHEGAFIDRADFLTGPFGGRLALGDVDGNGTLDLAVANGRGWYWGSIVGKHVAVFKNTFPSPPASIEAPVATIPLFAMPSAWPIPLRRGAELRLDVVTEKSGEILVELLDLQGRRVRDHSFRVFEAGRHSLTMPSQVLAPGLYFLRASQGLQQATRRVVVL